MSVLYKIKAKLLDILGDIRWFGFRRPLWFAYGVKSYLLRGEHYRSVNKIIKPGDILVRAYDCFVDSWFIGGRFSHGAVYVGGDGEQVVHSMSQGVFVEDLINFMRADHMAIYRPPKDMVENGVKSAISIVGSEYDFNFDFNDHARFSCTEVVDYCYPGLLKPSKYLWRTVIAPDDICRCDKFVKVWDSDDSINISTFKLK